MSDVAKVLPLPKPRVDTVDLMDEVDRLGPFSPVEDYQRLLDRAGGPPIDTDAASYLRGFIAGRVSKAVMGDGRDG